ncbi:ribokinase [Gloeocapsopsis dulcis]|uniref:Ribokinase n=1 Tax=Gloeocapsopsis dulcis AAB1 = 1H9 TaxID=1433147 RepID=A0A6N8FTA0_9CHRO|nr:ribokinase [Gloeocapsopsis dulcis]MUL35176.1 ribokinase [Gloeocapsopsis dulcis AAB1 = 1H9]WNN89061.1 ribokinase [Gloeocapsopsis dulcis]
MNPHVLVFGSINMDLVAKVPRLPVPGETLLGHNFATVPGGKGANQAVAVARLGVATAIIGRVGNQFGQELLHNLQSDRVQTDGVYIDTSNTSGVAVIAVDDNAENHIIVIPGANANVSEEDIERLTQLLPTASILLLQLEIPLSAVQQAAQVAQQAGVRVILDPAPAPTELPSELYSLVDIITPNAVETGQLVKFEVNSPESAQKAAIVLQQRGVKTVIIKLGAKGVFCASSDETFFIPAFSVKAVDTVAAGDAFNGGLATALSQGYSLREAVTWGAATGALSATKAGAQSSLPTRQTVEAFLQEHR